jgi:hypothetical protein
MRSNSARKPVEPALTSGAMLADARLRLAGMNLLLRNVAPERLQHGLDSLVRAMRATAAEVAESRERYLAMWRNLMTAANLTARERHSLDEAMDGIIVRLESEERAEDEAYRDAVRRYRRLARKSGSIAKTSQTVERLLDLLHHQRVATRDYRWGLILLRAELLPRPGGPVLRTAAELRRHLGSVRR